MEAEEGLSYYLTLTSTPPVAWNMAWALLSSMDQVTSLICIQPGLLVLSILELVFIVSPVMIICK